MAGASRETAASARPPHRERRSLDTFAPNLSAPFANAEFEFRSRTLNGQDQQAPRWRAIGAVIGHEMGHRFDDQGRRSDAKGQLRD